MTTEEKAKRYDEAIERANELNYVSDKDSLQRKTVDHIFPELKESEDERISKALIYFIKQSEIKGTIRTYLGVTEKEMLAWLEKQDKKDEEILILKDQIESLHAARIALKEVHKIELENQGEQKPAEWRITDEDMFRTAVWHIKNSISKGKPDTITKSDILDWFITFKDRVQPKQEWSEKDETALGDALWCCKLAASFAKDENDMGNVWYAETWLKSLKERYTWKPSDEQMDALHYVTNFDYGGHKAMLVSLYEQLKKLREE